MVSSPYLKTQLKRVHIQIIAVSSSLEKTVWEKDDSPERLNVYVALRASFPYVGLNYFQSVVDTIDDIYIVKELGKQFYSTTAHTPPSKGICSISVSTFPIHSLNRQEQAQARDFL